METISAISTPYGVGGIAIIRVSGNDAITLTDKVFRGRKHLTELQGNTIAYGTICRPDSIADEVIDEVLVSVFRAPHSFTGEDVTEIACHGSLYIQQEILQLLVDQGARLARAGEFTQRAFLNGRMDLTRAEAVADLIAAQSKVERDLALNQLRGGISTQLSTLRDRLLHLTSLLELELDFADHEDLEFVDRSELAALADQIHQQIERLCHSFKTGNAIRGGIPVAIVGPTNAGKSTLLNALLGEERAIVSDIHGTTRDTIEDTFVLQGVLLRLIDTAGIRETTDTIEALGIERSRKAMSDASIIIEVQSAEDPSGSTSQDTIDETPGDTIDGTLSDKQIIHVLNKVDLLKDVPDNVCAISAKNGQIEPLLEALQKAVKQILSPIATDSVCITNMRHYEALSRALVAIERVQQGLQDGLSGEFLSMDLQDCLHALGEVTGQITSQEVLNTIFSKFCIGK